MDEIDRNIIVALQLDGSAGLAELAKVAGLSVSATAERVKRLEERGVIRGWRADLDPRSGGLPAAGARAGRSSRPAGTTPTSARRCASTRRCWNATPSPAPGPTC